MYVLNVLFLSPSISTLFPYTTLFRSYLVFPEQEFDAPRVLSDNVVLSLEHRSEIELDATKPNAVLPRMHARELEVLRSEEHTSELQSRQYLVCRLLLEKKKNLLLSSS